MQARISLVTLGVSDLERSRRFYRDGLGFPMSSVGGDEVAFFHTGGALLSLYPITSLAADANVSPERSGFGGITLALNVRSKDEVDRALEEAAAAGAMILNSGTEMDWGGYVGYFTDPDGHPWEVTWNPSFPIGPDGSLQLPE